MQISTKNPPLTKQIAPESAKASPDKKDTDATETNVTPEKSFAPDVSARTGHSGGFPAASKLGQKKMPPNPKLNNIRPAETHGNTMTLRRSYGMVVSGYENVAKRHQLTADAAEQFGETVSSRIRELNSESIRKIEELPEYQSLDLDDIYDLGEEVGDVMRDPENYLKAFALLKNPVFVELIESTESVHRSFAEMMKDNGEEKLMFGVLEMIKNLGGLAGLQESTQVNQNNSSVNIRV